MSEQNSSKGFQPRKSEAGQAQPLGESHVTSFEESHFAEGSFGTDQGNFASLSSLPGTTPSSRGPLYFLIGAAIFLLAVILVIFMVRSFQVGRSLVGGNTKSFPATPSAQSSTPTPNVHVEPDEETRARNAVTDLLSSPNCNEATTAANTLISFASRADFTASDEDLFLSTLTQLSAQCGADYTVAIEKALHTSTNPTASRISLSPTWKHIVRAIPENAINSTEFTTEANNIRCQFGDSSVACSIYTYDYVSPPGCEGYTATYHLERAGDVRADCDVEYNSSVIAPYGATITHGDFACTADRTRGVECWSALSGHGFTIRRAEAHTF